MRPNYSIERMDLANMCQNGARSLAVPMSAVSPRSHHETFDQTLPGDLTVPSFGPRMVCTKCGTIGADARPNWKERATSREA